jgi:hypothetical protein
VVIRLVAAALLVGLSACSQTYHPEFHPEARYSFVQNISLGPPAEVERCKLGRVPECWRACMDRSEGEACYLMGLMFQTGHGVRESREDAAQFVALAAKLGYAPASIDVDMAAPYLDLWGHEAKPGPRATKGTVTSPGAVIIYGDLKGDVYVGR